MQFDQEQLHRLRKKAALHGNRRDGCLYLLLRNFLLRISLRGRVFVVADLLELAMAEAARLLGSAATPAESPLPEDKGLFAFQELLQELSRQVQKADPQEVEGFVAAVDFVAEKLKEDNFRGSQEAASHRRRKTELSKGRSAEVKRLKRFVESKSSGWEVSGVCIDGEGVCYFALLELADTRLEAQRGESPQQRSRAEGVRLGLNSRN